MGLWRSLSFLLVVSSAALLCRADLANITSQIITALEDAVDCASCQTLLLPAVQLLADLGDDVFAETLTGICETLQFADDEECAGTFQLTGRILSHDLRQISPIGTTAVKFCNAVFGLCQQPAVDVFTVEFPKPAPINTTKFVSSGKTPFQVVHISDVHIDRFYTVGADANCSESICCRNLSTPTNTINDPAQPFGNSHCDSPPDLAQSLISAMNSIGNGSAFSIFTGDVIEGAVWLVDQGEATSDLEQWNEQMVAGLQVLPMFPAIGNHDSAPVNSFPRNISATGVNASSAQFVFDTQSAGWEQFIGSAAADQVLHDSGSYSAIVPGMNLRIISMNTMYWYIQNYWLYDSDEQIPDPNGLLAFMVAQLQEAEDAGQRAWVIGHIPSGKADIGHDYSNYYNQIIQRYNNTIAAQFAGHSHMDQFEIAYSDFDNQNAETADSIVFIAPALTPTSGNPAFKVYDVDPDTFEVVDMKVYMTNISDPNFQTEPTWELYYSARDAYGPLVSAFTGIPLGASDPLNASFWHTLTEVFASNDTAFQEWNTRLSRGGKVAACTGDCATTAICDMRAARSENNCDVTSVGIQLRRDVEQESTSVVDESDACEGHGVRRMFRKWFNRSR